VGMGTTAMGTVGDGDKICPCAALYLAVYGIMWEDKIK